MDIKELVDSGSVVAVRAAMDEGLSPMTLVDKKTLLHYAIARGSDEVFEAIAAEAATRGELEVRHSGRTALFYTVRLGRRAAFELLLRLGADANCFDVEDGVVLPEGTALKLACDRGYLWAVDALLGAGADPNFVEPPDNRSSLETAARFGENKWHDDTHRVEIIEALLQAGADPNLKTPRYGRTALHELATRDEFGDKESRAVAALVRGGARFDVTDKDGHSPLTMAIDNRCEEAARCFLDAGASPKAPRYRKRSPLGVAIQRKLGELVVDLVARGALIEPSMRDAVAKYKERFGEATPSTAERRARPDGTDALLASLAGCERLASKSKLATRIEQLCEGGAWSDGEEWATLLLKALELSPTYVEVAEEFYGEPMTMEDDDEGPLRDGWFDEPFGLIDAVFVALDHACESKPARWGEVLLAACGALEGRGVKDEELLVDVLRGARALPVFADARELVAAYDAELSGELGP